MKLWTPGQWMAWAKRLGQADEMAAHIGRPNLDDDQGPNLIARILSYLVAPDAVQWTWLVDEDYSSWGEARLSVGTRSAVLFFSREFDGATIQQFMSVDVVDSGVEGTRYVYTGADMKSLRDWLTNADE